MIGIRPNTELFEKFFANYLDDHHYVKVNPYLQLEDYPNIFALGDITNIKV